MPVLPVILVVLLVAAAIDFVWHRQARVKLEVEKGRRRKQEQVA